MAWAYVASALGVIISVTGGLFLRRLLGEVAELRRQITGIDREMRAQRARVKFLRYLMEQDDEGENDEDLPEEAAVANGGLEPPPDVAVDKSRSPAPARRKKHLGLYIGGAVAALATVSQAARQAVRDHHGQVIIGAVTGAAVTAATVTMVTVQPWTEDAEHMPPSSAPTAAPSPTFWPPPTVGPPQPTTTGGDPTASPSPSTTEPEPSPSVSVSVTPSASAPPSPSATGSVVPISEESAPAAQPVEAAPSGGSSPEGEGPTGEPGGGASPTAGPAPPPSAQPPPDEGPPSATPAEYALCVSADVAPLPDVEACVLVTVRGAPSARRGAPTPAPRSGGPARA